MAFTANMGLHEAEQKRIYTRSECWTIAGSGQMYPARTWRCPIRVKLGPLALRRIVNPIRLAGDRLGWRTRKKRRTDHDTADDHGQENEAEN